MAGMSQTFKNPKPALLAMLKETGPADEAATNGIKKKPEGEKKKKRGGQNVRSSVSIISSHALVISLTLDIGCRST